MRRVTLALVCGAALLAACGDGIDEGVNEGRGTRGTIDGVTLETGKPLDTTTFPDDDSDVTGPDETSDLGDGPDDSPFAWTSIGPGLEEGYLEVPLDHADPSKGTVTLYLVRHLAEDPEARIGSLLVNPGGPGFGGSGLAYSASDIYGQDLLDRFDVIGWDPRGTGYSDPAIDCIDDYDEYFALDPSPDTPEEQADLVDTAERFVAGCQQRSGDLLPHVGTADTARDMELIRQALDEDQISYFGFSYGSELGATWATMFPETVRAAVLDGAVDPTVGYFEQNVEQAAGVDGLFAQFLAECSDTPTCAFHNGGDAEGAFDALHAAVDADPVPVDAAGRPDITQGVLDTAVAQAMYDESYWPQLEAALADLQDGDGGGVLELYDGYYGRFDDTWDDSLEAYFAIGCLDDPGSTGPDDLFAKQDQLAAAAPRLGRTWLGELSICSVWPENAGPPVAATGQGAGQILVVGTTGDAITPLAGSRKMSQAMEQGRLVVVAANQHTGYGVNRCVDDTVDGYLLDPTIPLPAETDCR